jgi:lipopolysaccharide biosynthesis glycosyltransferase
MLVPGLFAATGARARLGTGAAADVVIMVPPATLAPAERVWIEARGIRIEDGLDLSPLAGLRSPQERLTAMTMARLLLPEHFAGRYDRLLYLDADTAVLEDPARIFALDTGPFALAATPSGRFWLHRDEQREAWIAHFRRLGMTEPYRFFNSGVLLIDVAKWMDARIGERAFDFLRAHMDICILPDEDALNAVLDGAIAEVSPLWNMRAKIWAGREVRRRLQPVILHYDGPNKPWKRFGAGQRLWRFERDYRAYVRFAARSPWPDWPSRQWTGAMLRDALAQEWSLATAWLRDREAPMRRLQHERDFERAFLRYAAEAAFTDVAQGLVERAGGGLRLAPERGA